MTKKSGCLWLVLLLTVLGSASTGPFTHLPPFQPQSDMLRSDIPAVYKWNLADLCPSDSQWAEEIARSRDELEALRALHPALNTPPGFSRYLHAYFALDEKINRLTLYAGMQRDVATTDQTAIARHELALSLTEQLMQEGAVLRQAILDYPDKKLQATLKRDPSVGAYLPYIQALKRRADHMLPATEERLLSLAGDNLWAQIDLNELPSAMEKTYLSLISDMILPMVVTPEGKEVQLSFTNYGVLRRSADRNVRRQTVTAMLSTMKHYENTFAAALGEQAKFSWFLSRARGYASVLDAYLDKDDIDPAIYSNLIRTVRAHVEPLHKYVALRKSVLGLDDLHLYDMSVPMVASRSAEMDYNQGAALILQALAPLGEEYINLLKFGLDPANGWIDVYPTKDKERGAYSSAAYGVHPYVLMNFQNDFDDVSTLAHEYGHALHTNYAASSQSYQFYRYVPLLAEIASTCNEALLARYVIDHASSKDEKIKQLSELLETIRTTIYRQTMFAEFELKVHQLAENGEPINAEVLNSMYIDLVRSYFGPDYTIDEHDGIEWALVPHFYYKYYVYTYATGLAAGIAFADRILHEGPKARDAFIDMLKAGCSRPPLELVRRAGVDLTSPQAIESALKWFDEVVDELSERMVH